MAVQNAHSIVTHSWRLAREIKNTRYKIALLALHRVSLGCDGTSDIDLLLICFLCFPLERVNLQVRRGKHRRPRVHLQNGEQLYTKKHFTNTLIIHFNTSHIQFSNIFPTSFRHVRILQPSQGQNALVSGQQLLRRGSVPYL